MPPFHARLMKPQDPESNHVGTGIRAILSSPDAYLLLQKVWGGDFLMRTYVRDYLCPIVDGARILEIGCGPARILQHLPSHIEYVGYDMNPRYIDYASKTHKGRTTFHCQKIGDNKVEVPPNSFDIVLATGIFHHINDDDSGSLIDSAHACLRPGGFMVTLDPVLTENRSLFERVVMPWDRGQAIRTEEHYVALARRRFEAVHAYVRDDLVRIPFGLLTTTYNHLIMKCIKTPPA